MRKTPAFLVLAVAVILSPLVVESRQEASKPDPRCVLRIRAENDIPGMFGTLVQAGIGCGVVTTDGVFTAWHVVDNADRVYVMDWQGESVLADSVSRVAGQDAALIVVDLSELSYVPVALAAEKLTKRTDVTVIAYWGMGHSNGVVVIGHGYIDTGAPKRVLMSDISKKTYAAVLPFLQSMSGGPIFANGKLVALCSSIPSDGFGDGYTYTARLDKEILKN